MPHYNYRCEECGAEYGVFHSMTETHTECAFCGTVDSVHKILELRREIKVETKTGEIVKQFIEDSKRDIENERQTLSKRTKK
jgi:putative FmdB family regulatory protein